MCVCVCVCMWLLNLIHPFNDCRKIHHQECCHWSWTLGSRGERINLKGKGVLIWTRTRKMCQLPKGGVGKSGKNMFERVETFDNMDRKRCVRSLGTNLTKNEILLFDLRSFLLLLLILSLFLHSHLHLWCTLYCTLHLMCVCGRERFILEPEKWFLTYSGSNEKSVLVTVTRVTDLVLSPDLWNRNRSYPRSLTSFVFFGEINSLVTSSSCENKGGNESVRKEYLKWAENWFGAEIEFQASFGSVFVLRSFVDELSRIPSDGWELMRWNETELGYGWVKEIRGEGKVNWIGIGGERDSD